MHFFGPVTLLFISLWKQGISVCLCVCLCMCSSNISADQDQTDLRVSTWLLRGSRVCNIRFVWATMIPLINYFINDLQILLALSTIATIVMCAPEPITAEPTPGQSIYTCSGSTWTRILPTVRSRSVHRNWLLCINVTKWVWTESVPVWGDLDNKLESESVDVRV